MILWDQTLGELLVRGGPVMWPLVACSVIAIALIIDRSLAHLKMRVDYDGLVSGMRGLVEAGSLSDAREFAEDRPNPVCRVAVAYLDGLDLTDEARASIVEREGALALEMAERRLRGLSTIAHVATLMGLLGTVAGLVGAFHQIELNAGQVEPSDLAQGIWEALLTTAFGLSIAIPSLVAFHGFESRSDRMARRMGFMVSYLDQWLGKTTGRVDTGDGSPPVAPTIRED